MNVHIYEVYEHYGKDMIEYPEPSEVLNAWINEDVLGFVYKDGHIVEWYTRDTSKQQWTLLKLSLNAFIQKNEEFEKYYKTAYAFKLPNETIFCAFLMKHNNKEKPSRILMACYGNKEKLFQMYNDKRIVFIGGKMKMTASIEEIKEEDDA